MTRLVSSPNLASAAISRREALKTFAIGAGSLILPVRSLAKPRSDQLRLAFIGCGGQGRVAIKNLIDHHYVAFVDVDQARAAEPFAAHPNVPKYEDYRQLLDRHADEIDGVVIATPDHAHHPIGMACMAAGKHVYIEKPLAPTPVESRELAAAAKQFQVKTQLGVQGHTFEALRVAKEWIDAGAIGEVTSVYLWTDRIMAKDFHWSETPAPEEPVPANLNWDLWLASRPHRPYNQAYAPKHWRNWWDFGTGAIGDIAVHMFDAVDYVLDLGFPEVVEADVPAISAFTAPEWSSIVWRFPHRQSGAVNVFWSNGTKAGQLHKPAEVPFLPRALIDQPTNAIVFVGTEGAMYSPDMRISGRPRIFPAQREKDFLAHPPARHLPRIKGNHYTDWLQAIRDDRAAGASFAYGAKLTEKVLLGCFAQRTGKPIRWNRKTMKAQDVPEVDAFVTPPV